MSWVRFPSPAPTLEYCSASKEKSRLFCSSPAPFFFLIGVMHGLSSPENLERDRLGEEIHGSTSGKAWLELVVPALCPSVRRGAVAGLLQHRRAVLGRHTVLLLVPDALGRYWRGSDCDRLLRDRSLALKGR